MAAKRFDVDKAGAVASGLCAVHCALVGVAFAALPVIGLGFMADPRREIAFFSTAVLLAVWALVRGIQSHKDWRPSILLAGGFSAVALSHFGIGHACTHADHVHLAMGGTAPQWMREVGTILAVMGGLSIVAFHLWNHRLTQKGCGCLVCHPPELAELSHPVRPSN